MRLLRLLPLLPLGLAACGGGETPDGGGAADTAADAPAAAAPAPSRPTGEPTMPEWYVVDHDARTVELTLTAGSTNRNNYWNYNGAINGEMAIVVPEGYEVSITLINQDPNMPHSAVISDRLSNFTAPIDPVPVFDGAATQNPTSMVDATMPGETETITFSAAQAGQYSLVCTIPGHSALGMWLWFDVVAGDGQPVGVIGA